MLCLRITRRERGYECCYVTAVFSLFLFFTLQVTPSVYSEEMLLEIALQCRTAGQERVTVNQTEYKSSVLTPFSLLLIPVLHHSVGLLKFDLK